MKIKRNKVKRVAGGIKMKICRMVVEEMDYKQFMDVSKLKYPVPVVDLLKHGKTNEDAV